LLEPPTELAVDVVVPPPLPPLELVEPPL